MSYIFLQIFLWHHFLETFQKSCFTFPALHVYYIAIVVHFIECVFDAFLFAVEKNDGSREQKDRGWTIHQTLRRILWTYAESHKWIEHRQTCAQFSTNRRPQLCSLQLCQQHQREYWEDAEWKRLGISSYLCSSLLACLSWIRFTLLSENGMLKTDCGRTRLTGSNDIYALSFE